MRETYTTEELMRLVVESARANLKTGGPFAAAVAKDGELLALAYNTVVLDADPTAHAEMNAIRAACKKLGTHDLSGCALYTTGFPCPMCMSATLWAKISEVYYGCMLGDNMRIGFRGDSIYEKLPLLRALSEGESAQAVPGIALYPAAREECYALFEAFARTEKASY